MKRFNEFEVIIPAVAFDYFSENSITFLLSCFNVKFESKDITDCQIEYLVTAPSISVASAVRNLFFGLKSLVVASSSLTDKLRISSNWLIGAIRVVESDEID